MIIMHHIVNVFRFNNVFSMLRARSEGRARKASDLIRVRVND